MMHVQNTTVYHVRVAHLNSFSRQHRFSWLLQCLCTRALSEPCSQAEHQHFCTVVTNIPTTFSYIPPSSFPCCFAAAQPLPLSFKYWKPGSLASLCCQFSNIIFIDDFKTYHNIHDINNFRLTDFCIWETSQIFL